MRLESPPDHVELRVARYQFDGGDDRFDRNWLVIEGDVRADDLAWRFAHACLLSSEARSLGHWLRHVTNPRAEVEYLTFLEPNLWFDAVERSEDRVRLRVGLGHESGPPIARGGSEEPFTVDLLLPVEALEAASDSWLAGLTSFPER